MGPQAHRVFVRIEKLDRGPGALGVEIVRTEKITILLPVCKRDEISIRPHVIYLSNAAINSIHLDTWINQLSVKTQPVVLCLAFLKNRLRQKIRSLQFFEGWIYYQLSRMHGYWQVKLKCVVVSTKTELITQ